MLDHYSHVRMAAKRQAVATLGFGLIAPELDADKATGKVKLISIPYALSGAPCRGPKEPREFRARELFLTSPSSELPSLSACPHRKLPPQ